MSEAVPDHLTLAQQIVVARDEFSRATRQFCAALEARSGTDRSIDVVSAFLAHVSEPCQRFLCHELGLTELDAELAPIVDRLTDGDPRIRERAACAVLCAKSQVRDGIDQFRMELLDIKNQDPDDIPF